MKSKKLSARSKWLSMFFGLTVLLAVFAVPSFRTAAAGNSTDKFGPFAWTTSDGSSCHDDWAFDTFQRSFSVRDNGDGTFLVREDDKNGTFVTNGIHSPGKCSLIPHHGSTVSAGITGQMGGFFVFDVASSNYNPNACASNPSCADRQVFLANSFGTTAYCNTVCMWNFEYDSNDRTLKYRHWQDKSDNAGNDKFEGDIANQ